ncbi:hypothetical protein GINT2_000243 [Glugoides intestinalis]
MAAKDYKKHVEAKSKLPENAYCIDCRSKNPKWASTRYGTFFCLDCAAIRRSLGVYLDFVKSVNLDLWDKESYLPIEYGGNKNFQDYLDQKGLSRLETEERYKNPEVIAYSKELMNKIEKETGISLRSSEKRVFSNSGNINTQYNRQEEKKTPPKPSLYTSTTLTTSLSSLGAAIGTQVRTIKDKTVEYGSKIGSTVKLHAKTLIEKGTAAQTKPKKETSSAMPISEKKVYRAADKQDWS